MSTTYYKYRDPDKTYGSEILYQMISNVTDISYLLTENFENIAVWEDRLLTAELYSEDAKMMRFVDSLEIMDITHEEMREIDTAVFGH